MSLFKTTPEQEIKVYKIATSMKAAGRTASLITDRVKHALEYEERSAPRLGAD